MLYVWEAVSTLGRTSPDAIIKVVASRLGVDADSTSFQRTIQRDLKHLSDTGDLGVEYFAPDGAKISPDQESSFTNLRVEYFAANSGGSIPGGKLLAKAKCHLITPRRPMRWSVNDSAVGAVIGTYSFEFETQGGQGISLCIDQDDRPFKLIVARNPESPELTPTVSYIEEKYGLRAAVLLVSEKSISRIKEKERDGHVLIEARSDFMALYVKDLNSSTGSYFAPASWDEIQALRELGSSENTQSGSAHPLRRERQWARLTNQAVKMEAPFFLRLGDINTLMVWGE